MVDESQRLNRRIQRELEKIAAENWPVDGPFVTTLDEVASKVCSEFGMPAPCLNMLSACLALGILDIVKRGDKEELVRLGIRMYLSGLLQGAEWQKQQHQGRAR